MARKTGGRQLIVHTHEHKRQSREENQEEYRGKKDKKKGGENRGWMNSEDCQAVSYVKDSKTYKQNENTIAGRALNVGITWVTRVARIRRMRQGKQKTRIASNEAHSVDYKSFLQY